MEIDVTNCNLSGAVKDNKTVPANKDACKNLFRFVGPKSSEYYSEFKAISAEEQKTQEDLQMDEQKKEIEKAYGDTITSISSLSKKLTSSMPGMETDSRE